MHTNTGGICIRRAAGVVPRIRRLSVLDEQAADGCVLSSLMNRDVSSRRIIIDHPIIAVPEHEDRRLGALANDASQIDRAARFHVQVWSFPNRRFRNCK
ncbi:hypothetical protein CEXT_517451 [Caerostris extrusa]|uniref:Uncharacterized protein n=1 Tax=Caerostris extrusa TaxID=172846 RepID=A0AAV4W9E2_CAEEX|nr:hypothetical protein CEXT_517451 [Caerostris extrusa]